MSIVLLFGTLFASLPAEATDCSRLSKFIMKEKYAFKDCMYKLTDVTGSKNLSEKAAKLGINLGQLFVIV